MKKLLIAAVAFMGSAAGATTIDFQNLASSDCHYYGQSVTTQGYAFSSNNVYSCEGSGSVGVSNTSRALIGYANGYLGFARSDGQAFSLQSLFTGNSVYYGHGATGVSVVGTLAGGGTVTAVLNYVGQNFQQYILPSNFVGLSSVSMQIFSDSGGYGELLMVDDVVVDQAVVPEPAMLGLFGLGVIGLGLSRRRKAA